jgi:hypothetical protein
MKRIALHIAAVYRVKSYIILETFVFFSATIGIAWYGYRFGEGINAYKEHFDPNTVAALNRMSPYTAVSFNHTILVIMDFYVPILAAIGTGVFQGRGAQAAALQANPHETKIANLFSILLFTFVLGAPAVAYSFGDAKDVNNWLIGSATALSTLLVTGVGYYFGVANRSQHEDPVPTNPATRPISDSGG